jgi:hypothetical protein
MERTPTARPVSAGRPAAQRSRTTNHLREVQGLGRQSSVARRYADLVEAYTDALGGPETLSEAQRAAIRRAVELTTLTEQQRARALRGEPVDPLALVRLEGQCSRAVRALGIGSRPARKRVTLLEHLREAEGAA